MRATRERETEEEQAELEVGQQATRSALASEIQELKASIDRAISKRERLPQPMFWSLFHSRIKSIRERREISRLLGDIFGGQDS